MKNYNVKAHISYDVCSTIFAKSSDEAKTLLKEQLQKKIGEDSLDINNIIIKTNLTNLTKIPIQKTDKYQIHMIKPESIEIDDIYYINGEPYSLKKIYYNKNDDSKEIDYIIGLNQDNQLEKHELTDIDPFGPFKIKEIKKDKPEYLRHNVIQIIELTSDIIPYNIALVCYADNYICLDVSENKKLLQEKNNSDIIFKINRTDTELKENNKLQIYIELPREMKLYGYNVDYENLLKINQKFKQFAEYARTIEEIFYKNNKNIRIWLENQK